MAKDPATLWYWNDWAGGTITLARHLKGCYMDLLNAQFNSGRLSLDEIRTVLGSDFGSSWPTLQKKFKQDNQGLFFNDRAEKEKNKRSSYTESRRNNFKSVPKTDILHMENVNENIDVSKKKEIAFDLFWEAYGKKNDRIRCEKIWVRLTPNEKEKIMANVNSYISSTPDKKYRKDPATYLHNKSWENEVTQEPAHVGPTKTLRESQMEYFGLELDK